MLLENQNQRLERLLRGLRGRTLGGHSKDPEYRAMCEAIDDYRFAGQAVGEADFPAVLDAIADLIESHLDPSEEEVESESFVENFPHEPEPSVEYKRMEQRFQDVIRENDRSEFLLEMGALQVSLIHGSLRLSATHPEIKDLSPAYRNAARKVRDVCLECYRQMGFTEEEIEYLDSEETLT